MKIYNTQIFIFFSAQDGGHDMSVIDEHGQPIIRSTTNKSRLMDRSIDELIGFCKGTIADGVLNQDEAESLLTWIKLHPNLATTFPANVLFARLCDALDDGKLDSEEARDVFELIAECVGARLRWYHARALFL
jgi:tellurite resistance protein